MKPGLVLLALVATFVTITAILPGVDAIIYDVRDGQYISMRSGGIATIMVDIPMDAGMGVGEGFVYSLEMVPDPIETWSDFSFQRFMKVLNNNTASIAINFDANEKSIGDCASPYTLTLIVERGNEKVERSWRGGVCLSGWEDVDYVSGDIGDEPQDVMNTLNDHTDVFDMQIEPKIIKAAPGEIKTFNLSVGSSEPISNIQCSVAQGTIPIEPLNAVVSTSEESLYQIVPFSLRAPQTEGEYEFSIEGIMKKCDKNHCKKTVTGKIFVSETPEEETGFSVTVFPENIDSRNLIPVTLRYTVKNNLPEKTEFDISIETDPVGAKTTFEAETLEVGSGTTKTGSFRFTPTEQEKLYKIRITAKSGEERSSFTSVISTDEMISDTEREKAGIWDGLSDSEQINLGNEILEWKGGYKTSDYEENIDGYSSLKDTIDAARTSANADAPNDFIPGDYTPGDYYPEYDDEPTEESDYTFIIIVVVLCLGLFGAYFAYRKISAGKQDQGEFQEVKF